MKSTELSQLTGPLGPVIRAGSRDYLYFGGTAYLGIPQNKAFLGHYIRGLGYLGLNNGTSRNNNVQLGIYDEAEAYAAAYYRTEASLITSSGYLAAQLAVQYVSGLGRIAYAPGTHPALWSDGDPGVEGTFSDWGKNLVREINESDDLRWVLISNALNNLFPEVYDFGFLSDLRPEKEILILIDDSHGIGVLNGGFGADRNIAGADVIYVSSLAKGPGVDAGIILGSQLHINSLKQMPHFPGASPPAAAGLYAFMQSADIYRDELDKLKISQDYLMGQQLIQDNFEFIPEFPVFLHRDAGLASRLQPQNIVISAFPYPDAKGTKLNRIVLCSWHTRNHLKSLLAALPDVIKAS